VTSLDTMYQEIILDHYRHPHHRGLREPFDAEVRHVNPTCGDEVTLRVRLDGDQVADIGYESTGCSISQASASIMSDLLIGRDLRTATTVADAFRALVQSRGQDAGEEELLEDAVAFAGVSRYPARVKCALLAWMAWRDATTRALVAADRPVPAELTASSGQEAY
jgi:nitrogen fixation NifU-like protein